MYLIVVSLRGCLGASECGASIRVLFLRVVIRSSKEDGHGWERRRPACLHRRCKSLIERGNREVLSDRLTAPECCLVEIHAPAVHGAGGTPALPAVPMPCAAFEWRCNRIDSGYPQPKGNRRRNSRSNSRIEESRIFVISERFVARTRGASPADFLPAFTSKLKSMPLA